MRGVQRSDTPPVICNSGDILGLKSRKQSHYPCSSAMGSISDLEPDK